MASEFLRCAGYPAEHTDFDSSLHVLGVLRNPQLLEIQVQFQRKTKMQRGDGGKP